MWRREGGERERYVAEHRQDLTRGEQLRGDDGPADLKKTKGQCHEHLYDTGMTVRNGNVGSDRTITMAANVRKQLGKKTSNSREGSQEKNGGVKGRYMSAEELDRDTGEEQTTVGRTHSKHE